MHRGGFRLARFGILPATLLAAALAAICAGGAEAQKATAKVEAVQAKATELKPLDPGKAVEAKVDPKTATEIQQFCLNNAVVAGDARIAWQAAKLAELEAQVKQRIAELEAKRADYMDWLKKRDEALKKANDAVVAIYGKMRPEAAALQLAAMDDVMAAALLAKLNTRVASAILNEMEPGRAARLTTAIAGPPPADRKKS